MTPKKRRTMPVTERFDRHVNFNGPLVPGMDSPCWVWTAWVSKTGYASFTTGGQDAAKHHLSHRWNYERYVGPIPDGYQVDHRCKVRHCVNPAPPRVNNARSDSPSAINARRVLCARGLHVLAGENLSPGYLNQGARRCATCLRERQREKRARERRRQAS